MADEITSGASMLAAGAVDGNFLTRLRDIEQRLSVLEGANTVMADVGEITDDLGDVRAGRILALTSGYEPTDVDATGVVIDAAGNYFGGSLYNLVGLNNGVLMFGLSAIDGKAYFMGGTAIMDEGGLQLSGLGDLITMRADNGTGMRYATIGMQTVVSNPAITIQSYEPVFGSTVIVNGTFEGDTPGNSPANWTCVGLTATVQSPDGGHSTQYVKLEGDGTFTSDYFTATAGTLYYYSKNFTYIYLSGSGSTGSAILTVEYYDISYNFIKSTLIQHYIGLYDTAPEGAAYGRFVVTISNYNSSDIVTIDNVSVMPQTSVTIPATVRLDPYLKVTGTADFSGTVIAQTYRGVLGTQTYPTYSFQELIYFKNKSSYAVAPPSGFTFLFSKSDGLYINLSGTASQSRLALASEIPTLTYPDGYSGNGASLVGYTAAGAIIADNVIKVNDADTRGGVQMNSTAASAADGVYYILNLPLAAGTYRIAINYAKSANMGKFDLYMDGVKVSGATPLDAYAASTSYNNQWNVTGVVIATGGWHVLKILTNGKNASSSDYRLYVGAIVIHRTAA